MRAKIPLIMLLVWLSINKLATAELTLKGMIIGYKVNLRAEPNKAAIVLKVLSQGCLLNIIKMEDQWCRVMLGEGMEGWIYKDYITTQQTLIDKQLRFFARAQKLIDYAKKFLGTKYNYGGESPAGFDCSGYTMFIYAEFGYKLPHNALSQMKMGGMIKRGELTMGDLVFFSTKRTSTINHVGIYIGDNAFIHASSGSGRIKIDSMAESYYNRRYRGARRILNDEPA
jgi:uncharacterized protein YgiM (DUF1202 family)